MEEDGVYHHFLPEIIHVGGGGLPHASSFCFSILISSAAKLPIVPMPDRALHPSHTHKGDSTEHQDALFGTPISLSNLPRVQDERTLVQLLSSSHLPH